MNDDTYRPLLAPLQFLMDRATRLLTRTSRWASRSRGLVKQKAASDPTGVAPINLGEEGGDGDAKAALAAMPNPAASRARVSRRRPRSPDPEGPREAKR